MIRFVIPAYNEAENIPRLLADLALIIRILSHRSVWTTTSNGADGISDIEGKAARVAASKAGTQASFKRGNQKKIKRKEEADDAEALCG